MIGGYDAAAYFCGGDPNLRPLVLVTPAGLAAWLDGQAPSLRKWVESSGFKGAIGETLCMPGVALAVLAGLGPVAGWRSVSALPSRLPPGDYRMADELPPSLNYEEAAFGWAAGSYQFERYRRSDNVFPRLQYSGGAACRDAVLDRADALRLAREMIDTPAEDMGPDELAAIATQLASETGATIECIEGDALLDRGYRLLHAVGRASDRPATLIDLRWGDIDNPAVTLIGKGVTFDTGGLDMKSSAGMLEMKGDMGGAAVVIALARWMIRMKLPVRLRLLVAATDNAISGNALRPRDVVEARNGLTVEVGNTDAEGRLVLADLLEEAGREEPSLIVDVATLTNAARVALGDDISAYFTTSDDLARLLDRAGAATDDPVWRLPLWQPYAVDLEGQVAHLSNVADLARGPTSSGGAIYAALFLQRFVPRSVEWLHLDINATNSRNRPGRPRGGDPRSLLALYELILDRFT